MTTPAVLPALQRAAEQAARAALAGPLLARPAPATDTTDDAGPSCGWFESSWALRQGLQVSELPDSDGTVAALWFAALASPAPRLRA